MNLFFNEARKSKKIIIDYWQCLMPDTQELFKGIGKTLVWISIMILVSWFMWR